MQGVLAAAGADVEARGQGACGVSSDWDKGRARRRPLSHSRRRRHEWTVESGEAVPAAGHESRRRSVPRSARQTRPPAVQSGDV
jgi:hypothetical protein